MKPFSRGCVSSSSAVASAALRSASSGKSELTFWHPSCDISQASRRCFRWRSLCHYCQPLQGRLSVPSPDHPQTVSIEHAHDHASPVQWLLRPEEMAMSCQQHLKERRIIKQSIDRSIKRSINQAIHTMILFILPKIPYFRASKNPIKPAFQYSPRISVSTTPATLRPHESSSLK